MSTAAPTSTAGPGSRVRAGAIDQGAAAPCVNLIDLQRAAELRGQPAVPANLLESGAQGRDRTADTVIFSHVLYQLSYLGTGALEGRL